MAGRTVSRRISSQASDQFLTVIRAADWVATWPAARSISALLSRNRRRASASVLPVTVIRRRFPAAVQQPPSCRATCTYSGLA